MIFGTSGELLNQEYFPKIIYIELKAWAYMPNPHYIAKIIINFDKLFICKWHTISTKKMKCFFKNEKRYQDKEYMRKVIVEISILNWGCWGRVVWIPVQWKTNWWHLVEESWNVKDSKKAVMLMWCEAKGCQEYLHLPEVYANKRWKNPCCGKQG